MADRTSSNSNEGNATASTSTSSLWLAILASTSSASKSGNERANGEAPHAGPSNSSGSGERRVVLMGAPSSGKRSLVRNLAHRASTSRATGSANNQGNSRTGAANDDRDTGDNGDNAGLGLSFQYLDLQDSQDTSAAGTTNDVRWASASEDDAPTSRISLYTTSRLYGSPYSSLLSLALLPEYLQETLVLLMLDWEKPWDFISSLKDWLGVIEERIGELDGLAEKQDGHSIRYKLSEARERLEGIVRAYHEPVLQKGASAADPSSTSGGISSASGAPPSALSSSIITSADDKLPLAPGTLINNLGVGLVVVCTKSDQISALERNGLLSEEQIDYIQQCIRTICLSYGASVFCTSTLQPYTIHRLRSYILRRLFPRTFHPVNPDTSAPTPSQHHLLMHPFAYRANAIDRHTLLIPSGWDSFGKIKVLREGFIPPAFLEAWQKSMGRSEADQGREALEDAEIAYRRAIGDAEDDMRVNDGHHRAEVQDEQEFLRIHYEVLAREAAKRAAMAPANVSLGSTTLAATGSRTGQARFAQDSAGATKSYTGVVGPMANTSLSLPTVERALDRDREMPIGPASRLTSPPTTTSAPMISAPSLSRRESSRVGNGITSPLPVSPGVTGSNPTSPNPAGSGQNEVLANFFQSLLSARSDRSGAGSPNAAGHIRSGSGAGQTSSRSRTEK